MDLAQITSLFGRSIYDPLIDKALAEWGAVCEDKASLERYDSIKSVTCGLTFTFWYKGFYAKQIAEPTSTFKSTKDEEVILSEMTFRPQGLQDVPLPYGLRFGDTPAAIQQALGRKPFSKGKNVSGEPIWTFYDDDFEILVVFDKDNTLAWFRIWALHHAERKKRDLVENIAQQKKNISSDQASAIEKQKEKLPTRKWERRMRSGDDELTPTALADSEKVLSSFVDSVAKATQKKNATSIYSALKKAVVEFNKLSKKHRGFIGTMEREEIVAFLQDTVRLSGFVIEDGVDLTQDNRIW
ncbi:MAG: hypothetical protein KJ000_29000 [Pirellulaceae bacterium]|nr:hypothetical protein [Pirellulaceae bacterium]